jgi:hypothetical protein
VLGSSRPAAFSRKAPQIAGFFILRASSCDAMRPSACGCCVGFCAAFCAAFSPSRPPPAIAPAIDGLFRCEHCGSLITGERIKRRLRGGDVREHLYYRCANNHPGPEHPVVRWRAEELDDAIVEDLGRMRLPDREIADWFSHTLREVFTHEAEQRDRQQTILARRRAELTTTKDRLVRAFVSGAIDEGTLKAHTMELDAQMGEVNRGFEAGGDIDERRGDMAARLFDWTQNAAEDWRGSKIARKRSILEARSLNRRLSATSLCLEKRRPFRELSERPLIQLSRGDCPNFEPSRALAPFAAPFLGPPEPFILAADRLVRASG